MQNIFKTEKPLLDVLHVSYLYKKCKHFLSTLKSASYSTIKRQITLFYVSEIFIYTLILEFLYRSSSFKQIIIEK